MPVTYNISTMYYASVTILFNAKCFGSNKN